MSFGLRLQQGRLQAKAAKFGRSTEYLSAATTLVLCASNSTKYSVVVVFRLSARTATGYLQPKNLAGHHLSPTRPRGPSVDCAATAA